MPRNLASGAKIGSATYFATWVAIWPQKCKQFLSATMSPAGQVGQTQAIRLGSAFLAGAFLFWEKHDLEKVVRLGTAFLAGAFVFWEKHDLETVVRLGSAFLARAFVF